MGVCARQFYIAFIKNNLSFYGVDQSCAKNAQASERAAPAGAATQCRRAPLRDCDCGAAPSFWGAILYRCEQLRPRPARHAQGVSDCMGELQIQLAIIFVLGVLLGNFTEIVLPALLQRRKSKKDAKKAEEVRSSGNNTACA